MATKRYPSPLLLQRKLLAGNTGYDMGRAIVRGTAILNGVGAALIAAGLLYYELPIPALGVASTILFWVLVNQLAQAFFDIADVHLHRHLREAQLESAARNQGIEH